MAPHLTSWLDTAATAEQIRAQFDITHCMYDSAIARVFNFAHFCPVHRQTEQFEVHPALVVLLVTRQVTLNVFCDFLSNSEWAPKKDADRTACQKTERQRNVYLNPICKHGDRDKKGTHTKGRVKGMVCYNVAHRASPAPAVFFERAFCYGRVEEGVEEAKRLCGHVPTCPVEVLGEESENGVSSCLDLAEVARKRTAERNVRCTHCGSVHKDWMAYVEHVRDVHRL